MCKIKFSIPMLSKQFFDSSSIKEPQREPIQTQEIFTSTSQESGGKLIRLYKPTPEEIRSNRSSIKKRLSLSFPLMKGVNFSLDQKGLISTASSLKQIVKQDKINIKFFTQKKLEEVEELFFNYDGESVTFIKEDFDNKYTLMNKIGEGSHSSVYKCINTETNELFAVKITRKVDEQLRNRMIRQYKLLKILDHQHVLKVHELIYNEDQQKLYIISQLCQYPDLRHQLIRLKQINLKLNQKQILMLLQKILETVKYIQLAGICHRDLKPQNILYNPLTKQIKIIDFDVSKQKFLKKQDFFMWTNTGTLHYRAPETFNLGYSQKIDIWSIGIMLYQLISGEVPFNSVYQRQTIKKIKTQKIDFSLLKCTQRTKFLIQKMLQKQCKLRFSCQQCLAYLKQKKAQSKDDFHIQTKKIIYEQQNKCLDSQSLQQVCLPYRTKMDFIQWNITISNSLCENSQSSYKY